MFGNATLFNKSTCPRTHALKIESCRWMHVTKKITCAQVNISRNRAYFMRYSCQISEAFVFFFAEKKAKVPSLNYNLTVHNQAFLPRG